MEMDKTNIVGLWAGLTTFIFILINYVKMYEGLQIILGIAMLVSFGFFFYYLGKYCGINWEKFGKALE